MTYLKNKAIAVWNTAKRWMREILIGTGIVGVAIAASVGGPACIDNTAKGVRERIDVCPVSSEERSNFIGQKLSEHVPEMARTRITNYHGEYELEIASTTPIENGIEVLVRAWDKNGNPVGFGRDGTIETERVRIINPSILVSDPNGEYDYSYEDPEKGTIVRKFREDLEEALLLDLSVAVFPYTARDDEGKDGRNIKKGSVGNTIVEIKPANKDNYIISSDTGSNQGTASVIVVGDGSSGANNALRPIINFDVAGNVTSGDEVSSSTLLLFENNANDSNCPLNNWDVWLHQTLRNWNETESTWNEYSSGNSWTQAGASSAGNDHVAATSSTLNLDGTAANAYVGWQGAQLNQDIEDIADGTDNNNFGWRLRSEGELPGPTNNVCQNNFSSSEDADTVERPTLIVEHAPPAAEEAPAGQIIWWN